jgi:hypothetical protein
VLGLVFHPLLGAHESAAEEGRKVVLLMLATGLVFVLVIALGDLTHWLSKQRRRDED